MPIVSSNREGVQVDALMSLVLFEIGDFPMMRKMLRTLKQRAETGSRAED